MIWRVFLVTVVGVGAWGGAIPHPLLRKGWGTCAAQQMGPMTHPTGANDPSNEGERPILRGRRISD